MARMFPPDQCLDGMECSGLAGDLRLKIEEKLITADRLSQFSHQGQAAGGVLVQIL